MNDPFSSFSERCDALSQAIHMTYIETIDERDFDDLVEEFLEMDGNSAGGSLHIVLDDGNISRADVEFCRQYALNHNDSCGAALANLILELPDARREELLQ